MVCVSLVLYGGEENAKIYLLVGGSVLPNLRSHLLDPSEYVLAERLALEVRLVAIDAVNDAPRLRGRCNLGKSGRAGERESGRAGGP